MRKQISYCWRLFGTGLGFALLFGGGAVLAICFFPLLALKRTPVAEQAALNQRVIHYIFKFYVLLLRALGVLSITVENRAILAKGGGRIIIANHPTLIDVVLLMAILPRAQCIVKKELWSSPYLGGVMRYAGYIRNDLAFEELLRACRASLAAGSDLIVFPEGTRTSPGAPVRFKRGSARIALFLKANMQLVKIECTPLALVKGEAWWKIPPQKPLFTIKAGPYVEVGSHLEYEYHSLATRQLNRKLEGYFAESSAHG